MSRLEVSTAELAGAGHSLKGAAGGLLVMGQGAGSGTGTGELDAALASLADRATDVASLLAAAATVSGRRLAEGAGAYEQTDASQFSGGASKT